MYPFPTPLFIHVLACCLPVQNHRQSSPLANSTPFPPTRHRLPPRAGRVREAKHWSIPPRRPPPRQAVAPRPCDPYAPYINNPLVLSRCKTIPRPAAYVLSAVHSRGAAKCTKSLYYHTMNIRHHALVSAAGDKMWGNVKNEEFLSL